MFSNDQEITCFIKTNPPIYIRFGHKIVQIEKNLLIGREDPKMVLPFPSRTFWVFVFFFQLDFSMALSVGGEKLHINSILSVSLWPCAFWYE